ncbi:hypothetical protein BGV47_27375 [Burkholderia ubonensis]|nr:hypothetical protein BGV47_27375 [Burkholderia ubonensis]OJB27116.1 hypothetical protein BGV55_19995 [Burkholderia ubonensis]
MVVPTLHRFLKIGSPAGFVLLNTHEAEAGKYKAMSGRQFKRAAKSDFSFGECALHRQGQRPAQYRIHVIRLISLKRSEYSKRTFNLSLFPEKITNLIG